MKRKVDVVAKVYDKESNAEWRVPFFKVLKIKYFVIDLDSDYQWAVIGHPSRALRLDHFPYAHASRADVPHPAAAAGRAGLRPVEIREGAAAGAAGHEPGLRPRE